MDKTHLFKKELLIVFILCLEGYLFLTIRTEIHVQIRGTILKQKHIYLIQSSYIDIQINSIFYFF